MSDNDEDQQQFGISYEQMTHLVEAGTTGLNMANPLDRMIATSEDKFVHGINLVLAQGIVDVSKTEKAAMLALAETIYDIGTKNPLAFILAYKATQGGLTDEHLSEALTEDYSEKGVEKEDVIRYSRFLILQKNPEYEFKNE